jgi:hypothetical protein
MVVFGPIAMALVDTVVVSGLAAAVAVVVTTEEVVMEEVVMEEVINREVTIV